jgi:hypothetical protein
MTETRTWDFTPWCCNGNAEECALCDTGKLPYPWLCPDDHDDSPDNRSAVLLRAVKLGREALTSTMRRLRLYDEQLKLVETEDDCEVDDAGVETRRTESSAIQEWAEETDLMEAMGSFGDGYRRAQLDAQDALRLDRISARETAEWAQTGEHVYLSTGCLHDNHGYCRSRTGLNGLKRPAECKHCGSQCVCGCHVDEVETEITQPEGSVLSVTELRELYGGAIVNGMRASGSGGSMTQRRVHLILDEVLATRDRELTRLRQRLALAGTVWETFVDDLERQDDAVERAACEARVETLSEVEKILSEENQTPFDVIALAGPLTRLHALQLDARRELDGCADC